MSEDIKELLPCPFCGSDTHIMIVDPGGEEYYFAECQGDDECAGAMMDELSYATRGELVAAWNKRAPTIVDRISEDDHLG